MSLIDHRKNRTYQPSSYNKSENNPLRKERM